jgi:hypothetical protein
MTVTPDVSWRIERPSEHRYILRTSCATPGRDVAEHVEVDASQAGPLTRNLPQDAVIRPGEGVDMLIQGTWEASGARQSVQLPRTPRIRQGVCRMVGRSRLRSTTKSPSTAGAPRGCR